METSSWNSEIQIIIRLTSVWKDNHYVTEHDTHKMRWDCEIEAFWIFLLNIYDNICCFERGD